MQTSENSSVGNFVEVDLKYTQYLHNLHNGLPLAPGKLIIRSPWLSPFAKSFGIKPNKTPKLVETLLDKKNYVCHYQNLKFYVKHGFVVDKIHRVCQFEQSKWLDVYIEKNTVMRRQAKNDFEKNFYKLMSKFVSNPQQAETYAQRATFKSFQILRQDLVSVYFKNSYVVSTKPTPVEAAILDLSKLSLYKFHYEETIPRFWSSQLKVAYKDTDSLLYLIETPDLYIDMASFKHLLDLSDYTQDHFLQDPTNKKVPLTMTDELQGKVLREVVCLRSKLYSIDYVGGLKQSAKGVRKSVKKTLHHDLFRHCLFSKDKVVRTMTQLRSHCPQNVVNEIDKVAVSSFDDKRFLLDNGNSSHAYGHCKIGSTISDTTDRQTGCSFKMSAILWFFQPQSLGNSSHVFFCLDYSNGYDSSSVYGESTFFTSSSCSSATGLDSESSNYSETTEPRVSLHDMLKTLPSSCKLWQSKNFLCVKSNFYSSNFFIGL